MNNKGFSLMELIAVLAIMSILFTIGIASFNIKDNSKDQETKANVNTIEKAINVYYKILSQKGKLNYAQNTNDENVTETNFCINYENLVKNGYLAEERIPIDDEGNKYKYAFVTIKESNLTYINTNDISECQKSKTNITPITNKNSSQDDGGGNQENVNAYEFTSTISQTSENTYRVDSKFGMTIYYEIDVTTYRPIYTFIALDRSGSMDGSKIVNAVDAIKNLTTDLYAINQKEAPNPANPTNKPIYCTSVVKFGSSSNMETNFTDKVISPGTSAPDGTNYYMPMQLINNTLLPNIANYIDSSSSLCKDALNENPLYFILFLSDGLPFDDYGSGSDGITLKNNTEALKEKGVYIFTISYGYGNNSHLKCMASKVLGEGEKYTSNDYKLCNTYSDANKLIGYHATGTGTKVYYFESSQTKDSLTKVFNTFSEVATKESRKTDYDKVNITFTLNDKYFTLNNKDTEFQKTVEINSTNTKRITSKNDFNITLINNKFEDKEIKLFKSIKLEFIDVDKKVENKTVEVPDNQLPKVNVYKYKDTLIN